MTRVPQLPNAIARRPRVLVTVPNGDGWLHKHVAMALLRLQGNRLCEPTIMLPTWRPYEHNLNRCAAQALDDGYDYWLSIDADNPPTGNPLDRVSDDLDLVGFPTPVYHDERKGDRPWYFNALDYVDKDGGAWRPHEPYDGLQAVDCIGSGCFLVAVRVLRALTAPYFMREYNARGFVERGHDYLFSRQVKQHGFRVWADFDRPCQHFNELDILSVIRAFGAERISGAK